MYSCYQAGLYTQVVKGRTAQCAHSVRSKTLVQELSHMHVKKELKVKKERNSATSEVREQFKVKSEVNEECKVKLEVEAQ